LVKQASLAAQSGALDAGFKLPAVFQAPQEPIKARFVVPYITFAHPRRTDEWAKLAQQFSAVNEGEMYLVRQGEARHLSPAKMALIKAQQYWAEANAAGEILRVSFEERPKPYKEHIEAVVLLYFDEEVIPANVQFRTTKCPAGKALSDALEDASKPAWADKSPAHKDTLVCQQPFMRYYGLVSLGPQRTSKTSGLNYRPTVCQIKPTSLPEWKLLKAFVESSGAQKAMEDAAERYSFRLGELKAKSAK
jgi:hypothetical protein